MKASAGPLLSAVPIRDELLVSGSQHNDGEALEVPGLFLAALPRRGATLTLAAPWHSNVRGSRPDAPALKALSRGRACHLGLAVLKTLSRGPLGIYSGALARLNK